MSQRAMKYLHDKRIIYRRYSSDKPTAVYDWGWYYADGTYGYYSFCLLYTSPSPRDS